MGALIALAIASVLALATTRGAAGSGDRARSDSTYRAIRVEMDSSRHDFQLAIWRARYSFLFDDSVRTEREIDSLVSRLGRLESQKDSARKGLLDSTRITPWRAPAVPATRPPER